MRGDDITAACLPPHRQALNVVICDTQMPAFKRTNKDAQDVHDGRYPAHPVHPC